MRRRAEARRVWPVTEGHRDSLSIFGDFGVFGESVVNRDMPKG